MRRVQSYVREGCSLVLLDISFFVIGSTTHLSGWNCIIHFSFHLSSLLRSSCKVLLSDETVRYAMVPSANSLTTNEYADRMLSICYPNLQCIRNNTQLVINIH